MLPEWGNSGPLFPFCPGAERREAPYTSKTDTGVKRHPPVTFYDVYGDLSVFGTPQSPKPLYTSKKSQV